MVHVVILVSETVLLFAVTVSRLFVCGSSSVLLLRWSPTMSESKSLCETIDDLNKIILELQNVAKKISNENIEIILETSFVHILFFLQNYSYYYKAQAIDACFDFPSMRQMTPTSHVLPIPLPTCSYHPSVPQSSAQMALPTLSLPHLQGCRLCSSLYDLRRPPLRPCRLLSVTLRALCLTGTVKTLEIKRSREVFEVVRFSSPEEVLF
ncbi:hypothetical protein M9H77_01846 [Catharanthus roseus]|uniref:Uncharacterized protein n=1 Tax=Catharanthus roseus TaxID=4058 RepID=A0ACC0C6V3_CATRO|nr:hypothetical protein M9H77_01846 [Catharanthus roseus]